jgi:hypothetical protein
MGVAKHAPKFAGFPEPKTNFTGIPNLFFDEVMRHLKEGELKVLLYIFRHTYGWQKDRDCISVPQFVNGIVTKHGKRLDWGTGLVESTVKAAIGSLVKNAYVLRYIVDKGKGRAQKSHFFLNTAKNRELVAALESGQIAIEEIGAKFRPKIGPKFDPNTPDPIGPKSEPTKQRKQKKEEQKKGAPPMQNSEASEAKTDAVELLREQLLTHRRRSEAHAEFTPLGDIFRQMATP